MAKPAEKKEKATEEELQATVAAFVAEELKRSIRIHNEDTLVFGTYPNTATQIKFVSSNLVMWGRFSGKDAFVCRCRRKAS